MTQHTLFSLLTLSIACLAVLLAIAVYYGSLPLIIFFSAMTGSAMTFFFLHYRLGLRHAQRIVQVVKEAERW